MINFGLNDAGINFEVALEILGQKKQPLLMAIAEEKKKDNPSEALIEYCEARKSAITLLQMSLKPGDLDTINKIFDKNNGLF